MFSFKTPKPKFVNTGPEITTESKKHMIIALYMPYWVYNNTFCNEIWEITFSGDVIQ